MAQACRKCLLTDKVENVTIDEQKLCDYCAGRKKDEWEERFHVTEERKQELREEFDRTLENSRGQYPYDCVLALSGGKDSTYLLYYLTEIKNMKVLAAHVNVHFESPVAEKNIELLKKKIKFDLEIIDPGEEFYIKFYRTLFKNPVREGYIKSICYYCGPLYIGLCMKLAVQKKIPLVILGLSPNQPDNLFFEWGREVTGHHWIPDLFQNNNFDKTFLDQFWDPAKYLSGEMIPRVLAPLHVMKYDAPKIIQFLEDKKILSRKRSDTTKTNCDLNWPMLYLDKKLLGYTPYIKEFSATIRRGEHPRTFFKIFFILVDILINFGLLKRKKMKELEKKMDIKFADCIQNRKFISRHFVEYP